MRLLPFLAVALLMAPSAGAQAQSMATREACAGPFGHCAVVVNGFCSRDADGVQRFTFREAGGRGPVQFEQCVGKVYESRGLPNPYKTGAVADDLPFPRAEVIESDPGYN